MSEMLQIRNRRINEKESLRFDEELLWSPVFETAEKEKKTTRRRETNTKPRLGLRFNYVTKYVTPQILHCMRHHTDRTDHLYI